MQIIGAVLRVTYVPLELSGIEVEHCPRTGLTDEAGLRSREADDPSLHRTDVALRDSPIALFARCAYRPGAEDAAPAAKREDGLSLLVNGHDTAGIAWVRHSAETSGTRTSGVTAGGLGLLQARKP
jgi:hypothetical protein